MNYHDHAKAIADLVTEKQAAYGDSFGKSGNVMREFYPNGVSREQLDDSQTITRIVDKLFRVATRKDAFGESPWRDIMGYALLALARDEASSPWKGYNKAVQDLVDSGVDPVSAMLDRVDMLTRQVPSEPTDAGNCSEAPNGSDPVGEMFDRLDKEAPGRFERDDNHVFTNGGRMAIVRESGGWTLMLPWSTVKSGADDDTAFQWMLEQAGVTL